jgi:hypothetical protein
VKVCCGCRFPDREIEEPQSSSGREKRKDPVCTSTFQPAGCEVSGVAIKFGIRA